MQPTGNLPHFENFALLDEPAAGVLMSGDSGTGKSNLMYGLMTAVLRTNCGAVLLDPHGDMTDDYRKRIEPIATSGANDRVTP